MAAKHGGNIQEISEQYQVAKGQLVDFSANINPLGIPAGIKEVLHQGIDELVNYPDIRYRSLKEAIAAFHNIAPQQVYASNGAAESIFMLGRVLPVKKLLLLAPTFVEYEEAFQQQGTEFCYFNLEERDFRLAIPELIAVAKAEGVDGICLCNPNNPTGQLVPHEELLQLLAFCQSNQLSLILDEAFVDFHDEANSLVASLQDHPQLYIFRSLTKMFAIPGLRLGYLLTADHKVLDQLEAVTVPWHINTFADLAGRQALQETSFIQESQQYVQKERQFLVSALAKFADQLEVFPSQTNFLFFRYHGSEDLQQLLIPQGFLIRNCNTFKGLTQQYYRIAVKSRQENEGLLQALEEVL